MTEKLRLLKLVDEIDDIAVLKSIIQTHALMDGTCEWTKETADMLSMDADKRLSQTELRIHVVALCIPRRTETVAMNIIRHSEKPSTKRNDVVVLVINEHDESFRTTLFCWIIIRVCV